MPYTNSGQEARKVVRRQALVLGGLASLFALIGRATARAADALTVDESGTKVNGLPVVASVGNNLRIICGRISPQGRTISGEGFNPQKGGPGTYIIAFNPAFRGDPVVSLTPMPLDARAAINLFWNDQGKTTAMTVGTGGLDGKAADREFHFIAIGR